MQKAEGLINKSNDKIDFSEFITCSISMEILNKAVTVHTGHSYQDGFIQAWLQRSNTNPLTGMPLQDQQLRQNLLLSKVAVCIENSTSTDGLIDTLETFFRCSVTKNIFTDPVLTDFGNTFERSAIRDKYDPIAQNTSSALIPNFSIAAITEYFLQIKNKIKKNTSIEISLIDKKIEEKSQSIPSQEPIFPTHRSLPVFSFFAGMGGAWNGSLGKIFSTTKTEQEQAELDKRWAILRDRPITWNKITENHYRTKINETNIQYDLFKPLLEKPEWILYFRQGSDLPIILRHLPTIVFAGWNLKVTHELTERLSLQVAKLAL